MQINKFFCFPAPEERPARAELAIQRREISQYFAATKVRRQERGLLGQSNGFGGKSHAFCVMSRPFDSPSLDFPIER
jgi:hypothetical protein